MILADRPHEDCAGGSMIAKLKTAPQEQRLRLSLVPWKAYVAFCDCLGERYLRVTYDQGELEVMSPSRKHEKGKKRLGRLVETLTEELEIDIEYGGSMTCRNEEMLRALEPDDCYWIAHELEVRDKDEIDLDTDPPPDLALEIEISRSMLDRMSIYAALRVPEVWRWDGDTLSVHLVTARGLYRLSKRSKTFPFLPLDEFTSFLGRSGLTQTQLIRAFRAWVREHREEWER
jgi:Uma2 family endonuclease